MSTILPFPKRRTRTSPQPDPARVAVNVTAPDCEAVRDMFKRARMRVLSRIVTAATLADDMVTARRAQAELTAIQAGLFRASKAPSEVA
jgi:hypothetical protein